MSHLSAGSLQRLTVVTSPTKREDIDEGSNINPDNQIKNVQAPGSEFGVLQNVPTELLQQQVHQNPELLDQQMTQDDQQSELYGQRMRPEDEDGSQSR